MANSKIVPIRIPEVMLRFIRRQAQRRGLTISGYLKFLVQKEMEK